MWSFFYTDTPKTISRRLNHVAVYEIRCIIDVHLTKETVIYIESCSRTFINPARVFTKWRNVITVFRRIHEITIGTVLTFCHTKWLFHIFGIVEIITCWVFYLIAMDIFLEIFSWKIEKERPTFRDICIRKYLLNFCPVFFFWELLIHKAILLVYEVTTKETILTADTAIEKPTIATIHAIGTIKELLRFLTLYTLKTLFTSFTETRIHRIFAVGYTSVVETFFIEIGIKDEIAITTVTDIVRVVWILQWWYLLDMYTRDFFLKRIELGKKWSIEIKFYTIITRIIAVRKPIISEENRIFWFWFMVGDYFLPCCTAFSLVEFSFIAKCETSSLSFFRTELRGWYAIFFSWENWRHFVIKFEIFVSDDEILSREETFFRFDYFFRRKNKWRHIFIKSKYS